MQLSKNGIIASRKWEQLDKRFPEIEIDEFFVMPDPTHRIIVIPYPAGENRGGVNSVGAIHELPQQEKNSPIARRQMTFPMVIGFYKMNTTKAINIANDTRGTPVWQRTYYEHIIRDEGSLNLIRRYMQENPIKWSIDTENLNRQNQ